MLLLLRSNAPAPPATVAQDWTGGTGAADGVAIGTSNTNGAGNTAFSAFTGTGPTFTSTRYHTGTLAAQWSVASGAVYGDFTIVGALNQRQVTREYFYFPAIPSSLNYINSVRTGAQLIASCAINATGKIELRNTNNVVAWTSTNTIPLNQWFRIEWAATNKTGGGTTGELELSVFNDAGTLLETSGLLTGQSLGATATNLARLGGSTATGAYSFTRDDYSYTSSLSGSGNWIGPVAGAQATGDMKVFDGTNLVAKPVKVWTGSAWVKKPTKVYDGASFVTTTY